MLTYIISQRRYLMPNNRPFREGDIFYQPYYDGVGWKLEIIRIVKTKINKDVVIPETLRGQSVCRICSNVFAGSKVETVKFPDTIEHIGFRAFRDCCNLLTVHSYQTTNPAEELEIREGAFENCTNLKEFSSMTPVSYAAGTSFRNCVNLTMLDAQIKSIGAKTFEGCANLNHIVISDGGSWTANSFVRTKSLKDFYIRGAVKTKASALNILMRKNIYCTSKFNHSDLIYSGAKLVFVDEN